MTKTFKEFLNEQDENKVKEIHVVNSRTGDIKKSYKINQDETHEADVKKKARLARNLADKHDKEHGSNIHSTKFIR